MTTIHSVIFNLLRQLVVYFSHLKQNLSKIQVWIFIRKKHRLLNSLMLHIVAAFTLTHLLPDYENSDHYYLLELNSSLVKI